MYLYIIVNRCVIHYLKNIKSTSSLKLVQKLEKKRQIMLICESINYVVEYHNIVMAKMKVVVMIMLMIMVMLLVKIKKNDDGGDSIDGDDCGDDYGDCGNDNYDVMMVKIMVVKVVIIMMKMLMMKIKTNFINLIKISIIIIIIFLKYFIVILGFKRFSR